MLRLAADKRGAVQGFTAEPLATPLALPAAHVLKDPGSRDGLTRNERFCNVAKLDYQTLACFGAVATGWVRTVRMYLSSFDLGNASSELVGLAPAGRVALIMNALDNRPEGRERWRVAQARKLEALGLSVRDLDLRDFFGDPRGLRQRLREHDMVWINGGNAFILRRAMKLSCMDTEIVDLLKRDDIVYAGFSAAAVIVSHSLHGLEAVDDPHDVPEGYPAEIEWTGLGLLPFNVVVHHQSNHPESAAVEREIEHYRRSNIPYRTLRDGEAFVMRGGLDSIEKVGAAT